MTPEQRAEVLWRVHPKELLEAKKTRIQFYADHIRAAENDALERAASAMQPVLRSMLSRSTAAETIRALKS